jgi:phospholipid/cholesterol/gamma-HCH transport system ATP-binding protein
VGKSVLLKLLIGLMPADAGEIYFAGETVHTMGPHELTALRQRVGMVFQSGALFDSLTVGENVAYGLREHAQHNKMKESDIAERVAWALTSVGLPGVESMMPSDLSGGMRKRVGVARTVALRPEVILYDEPNTGLDPINTARINHLITRLQRRLNITSVIVTHDMGTAFGVSDRLAMVYRERILESGTKEQMRHTNNELVQDFILGRAPEEEDVDSLLSQ